MRLLFVCLAMLVVSLPAQARQRHSAPVRCVETGSVMFPVCGMSQPIVNGTELRARIKTARQAHVVIRRAHVITNPQRHQRVAASEPVASWPLVAPVESWIPTQGRPSHFIGGHLICAVNVGLALAERGIKGTGSALALSYLHWGRSAGGPVPGAVIVSARRGGGHVAIVSRVENGIVYAWNATGGQRGWREIPYRHHVIDYRVAG